MHDSCGYSQHVQQFLFRVIKFEGVLRKVFMDQKQNLSESSIHQIMTLSTEYLSVELAVVFFLYSFISCGFICQAACSAFKVKDVV